MRQIQILLLVLLIIAVPGCNHDPIINEHDQEAIGVVQSQESQDDELLGVGDNDIEFEKDLVVGTWYDSPSVYYSSWGERYHFYDDGNYFFEYSNGGAKRRINESGTWDFANNTLTLVAKSETIVEGGEEVELLLSDTYIQRSIENGKIKIVNIPMSEQEEYVLKDFFQDIDESVERRTAFIKGAKYWKLNNDPGAYLNKRQYDDGDAYCPVIEGKPIIGTWHGWFMVPSQLLDRYHFYDDWSYIYEYSNYDTEKRILSEMGTWNIENDKLTIIVNSKVTIEGGEKTEPSLQGDPNEYQIINGTIRIVELDIPEIVEFRLGEAFIDKEGSPGYWAMDFGGMTYWRLSPDPDAYQNDQVEDGDVYRPRP